MAMPGPAARSRNAKLFAKARRASGTRRSGNQRGAGAAASSAVRWGLRNALKVWSCFLLLMAAFAFFIQLREHPDSKADKGRTMFERREDDGRSSHSHEIPPIRSVDEILDAMHGPRPPPKPITASGSNDNNSKDDRDSGALGEALPPRPPPPSAGQGPNQDTDSSVRAAPSTAEGPGV
ncbi:unnamed protein product, partial [Ectocarpus sp. 12 AP-2014]